MAKKSTNVPLANKRAINDLIDLNDMLRAIENLAHQLGTRADEVADNDLSDDANGIAVALGALCYRAGALVDSQLVLRGEWPRGWVENPLEPRDDEEGDEPTTPEGKRHEGIPAELATKLGLQPQAKP